MRASDTASPPTRRVARYAAPLLSEIVNVRQRHLGCTGMRDRYGDPRCNFRGKDAATIIDAIQASVEATGARALKFKVGGRLSRPESPAGRTKALIPLVRKTFGDSMVIYADANGSYDAKEAIRIGKMMQDHAYDFFEEHFLRIGLDL